MNHFAFFSYLEVHSIHPNNAIHSIQLSVSPLFDIWNNSISNLRQYAMRYLRIIHLFNMTADISISHSKTIQANYFISKTIGQNGLSFPDYIGFKTAVTVLWRSYLKATVSTFYCLFPFSITLVSFQSLCFIQMSLHLSFKSLFNKSLQQWSKSAVRTKETLSRFKLFNGFLLYFF